MLETTVKRLQTLEFGPLSNLTFSFRQPPFHLLNTLPTPAPAYFLTLFMRADRQALYMWNKVQSTVNLPFSPEADRPGEKQLVINPMGMFTVSSGMPLNPQCSINGSDQNRLTENLGEIRKTLV